MDKYTIDLDKVLNDFEYSELTEQSNGYKSTASDNSNQPVFSYATDKDRTSSEGHTYPKIPSTTVKHSINNVFHSLNEYLNSDIKDIQKPELSEINEIEANIPSYISRPQTSIENIFKNISTSESITNQENEDPPSYSSLNFEENKPIKHNNVSYINSNLNFPSTSTTNLIFDHQEILPEKTPFSPTIDPFYINSNLTFPARFTNSETILENKFISCDSNIVSSLPINLDQNLIIPADSNPTFKINTHINEPSFVKSSHTFIENNFIDSESIVDDHIMPLIPKNEVKLIPIIENIVNITNKDLETKEIVENLKNLEVATKNESKTIVNESVNTNLNNSNDKIDIISNVAITETNIYSKNNEILPDSTYSDSDEPVMKFETIKSNLNQNNQDSDINLDVESPKPNLPNLNKEIKNDLSKNTNTEYIQKIKDTSNSEEKDNLTKENIQRTNEAKIDDIKENLIKPTETTKISFQNDFDMSETEMENELAQLEEEYKEKIINEAKNIDDIDGNVETEKIVDKIDDKDIVQKELEMESVMDVEQECLDEEKIIVDLEVQHENKDNAQIDNNVNISDKNLNLEAVSNVNIKVQMVKNMESEVVDEKEKTEERNDVKVEEIECNADVNRDNFALLRPNSLDLNNSDTPENAPINLIGNPGSTPYNNVYLENSIESEDNAQSNSTNEAENEANHSLSPTVSEVSTSEASDSPNTSDSCNDTSLDDNLNDSKTDKKDVKTSDNATQNEASESVASSSQTEGSGDERGVISGAWLGKTAPFWTPDSDTLSCLHCNLKFTVIKRRHHCRACGLVLCSKCCNMKHKLEYMENAEARVCSKCYEILTKDQATTATSSGSEGSTESQGASPIGSSARPMNPGNPMDYCSVVPPLEQVGNAPVSPPSVMVPVGVLKRKGSGKSRGGKSVMFCDGIRPGCDLTELDYVFDYKTPLRSSSRNASQSTAKHNRNLPKLDTKTNSYIPNEENSLPPTVNVVKSDISYTECANNQNVVEMLKNETLTFAIQRNLHIHVKIINMDCCINKFAWCFSTEGMIAVGQDEIVILLEFVDNEKNVPKDMFLHLNNIYNEAVKGTSITEMGLSIHNSSNFLESKNHAGFLYVKPTFQCVQNVIIPKEPYLIGILIHRWETPWAKIFPLRLLLRLGAEYRYYPSPIISTRHRESVYVEIGHTIINLLADFRNFSYTLPNVRGLTIHMKEKNTTVSIPVNRYDQVMKALNNSSDHILAFAANFSPKADSHLVCIQDTHGNNENAYTTHAINIHNKPRKVTGASFIVLNGALKSSSGLTAKSSIVEDGLMIQILPEQMVKLRSSLRNMKDFKINCGCVNAQSDEFVNIVWTENDVNFNVGVNSPIDSIPLSGIPSIRVHNGRDYVCNSGNKMIRWTEVFIMQSGDENLRTQEPVDISKLSESISKATCQALVKYLDLLATNSFLKIGIRTTLHVENVSYLAGANGVKLPPIYMKSLDNELIPILHKITSNNLGENAIVIELIFHILNM